MDTTSGINLRKKKKSKKEGEAALIKDSAKIGFSPALRLLDKWSEFFSPKRGRREKQGKLLSF